MSFRACRTCDAHAKFKLDSQKSSQLEAWNSDVRLAKWNQLQEQLDFVSHAPLPGPEVSSCTSMSVLGQPASWSGAVPWA
eukprot:356295-Pelagomonas_calceolata.AAC.6